MRKLKKKLVLAILFIIGSTSISTSGFAQSYGSEIVIGSVSGSLDAGDAFELYKYSADNLRDYLAGWKDVGWKDNRITYSSNEIYNKCLEKAKRQYGRNYPNLYLKYFNFDVNSMFKNTIKEYFGADVTDDQISYMRSGLGPTGGKLY